MQSQCVLISFPVFSRGSLPQIGKPDYFLSSVRTQYVDQSKSAEDDGQEFLLDQSGARRNAVGQEFRKVSIIVPRDGTSNDGKQDYELTQCLEKENGSQTCGSPDWYHERFEFEICFHR